MENEMLIRAQFGAWTSWRSQELDSMRRWGQWGHPYHMSMLSVPGPFPTLTSPIPVWKALSPENTTAVQMDKNCQRNGSFLTILMEFDPPTVLPCIALSTWWGWFLPFTASHFDLSGPRYAVAKSQKDNIFDSSDAVLSAMRAKNIKRVKTISPWNRRKQKNFFLLLCYTYLWFMIISCDVCCPW